MRRYQNLLKSFQMHIDTLPCLNNLSYSVISGLEIRLLPDEVLDFFVFIKQKEFGFDMLIDICGVDYVGRKEKRFEIVYQALSMGLNCRLTAKVLCDEEDFIPSLTELFKSAGWYEREIWDMYGVFFLGNDDLRRILTDYGFLGHPLRKDFPLSGHHQVRFNIEKNKVTKEDVILEQEYRNFDLDSPWKGIKNVILPGDEKASS